jgi:murein DD-endopeptidase MepM/ murein hydrolase activator NlpD
MALAITALGCAALGSAASAGTPPDERRWDWPMSPRPAVARTFDAPDPDWQHGHRGVDLLGQIGAHISAIGAGTVSFVGAVGGNDVVVITHGTLRSTYQPVLARVHKGEHVGLGQLLGTLELAGSHCIPDACLHLGVLRGETYLDPLDLFGAESVRLLPLDEPSTGRSGPARRPVVSVRNAPGSFSRSTPEQARWPARPGSRSDAVGVALRTLLANN